VTTGAPESALHIEEEERLHSETVVLGLYGDADLRGVDDLRARLAGAMQEASHVVVDLSGTTFIDSAVLGVLLVAMKRLRMRGGRLDLVVPSGHIRRIFELTLLDRILYLHPTRDDALLGRPS
jgi:anti-sigma B factor antagonist